MSVITKGRPKTKDRSKEATGRRRKKPAEMLSSVVQETAVSASLELLRENTRFALPSEQAWVVLLLEAEAIGGLSRKHDRDEAKGQLIQLISADHIQTIATEDMLREEVFGIIPSPGTLERMEDFTMLTQAPYTWAVVYARSSHEIMVDMVAPATFMEAQGIADGSITLRDVLGDELWAQYGGRIEDAHEHAAEGALVQTGSASDGSQEAQPDDDVDELLQGPVVVSDSDAPDDVVWESGPEESFTGGDSFVPEEQGDEQWGSWEGDPGALLDEDRQVDDAALFGDEAQEDEAADVRREDVGDADVLIADQEQVRASIARRFLSEDLDLVVPLDEFRTSFSTDIPAVLLPELDGAGEWLGDQITRVTHQANAELRQLHAANTATLQATYVNLMGQLADSVIDKVSLTNRRYGSLREQSEREYNEKIARSDETIRTRQAEITERFEVEAQQAGEQAARAAELQYRERHRAAMRREHAEVVSQTISSIEDERSAQEQQLLTLRRRDAERHMARGQTQIFTVLAEEQQGHHKAEQECLQRWNEELRELIAENRSADISRVRVLGEEQARVDRVAELKERHEKELERISVEHRMRLQRIEEEYERSRDQVSSQMVARDEEWKHALELEREKTASQTQRVNDLLGQMDRMGETFQEQYDTELKRLRADRDQHTNDLLRANELSRRSTRIMTALMIALPLLGGAAGYIAGATF